MAHGAVRTALCWQPLPTVVMMEAHEGKVKLDGTCKRLNTSPVTAFGHCCGSRTLYTWSDPV
jgi:hypothetical protein